MTVVAIARLPWHRPTIRVLEWPALHLPFNNYIIFKDGREYTFRSVPMVVDTKYKFDPPALLAAIIAWKDTHHVFSSREVELRARHDEKMKTALRDASIGKALGMIRGQDFDGYCINSGDERGVKFWWVIPSR